MPLGMLDKVRHGTHSVTEGSLYNDAKFGGVDRYPLSFAYQRLSRLDIGVRMKAHSVFVARLLEEVPPFGSVRSSIHCFGRVTNLGLQFSLTFRGREGECAFDLNLGPVISLYATAGVL